MKLSKKSRYGFKALIDLMENSKTEQVALNSIAERNDISVQYLEQVFAALRKAGIIKSVKGPQGGYFLAKKPREITAAMIIEALDGSFELAPEEAPEDAGYKGKAEAIQKLLIDQVNESTTKILEGVTLEDLGKEAEEYQEYAGGMYYI